MSKKKKGKPEKKKKSGKKKDKKAKHKKLKSAGSKESKKVKSARPAIKKTKSPMKKSASAFAHNSKKTVPAKKPIASHKPSPKSKSKETKVHAVSKKSIIKSVASKKPVQGKNRDGRVEKTKIQAIAIKPVISKVKPGASKTEAKSVTLARKPVQAAILAAPVMPAKTAAPLPKKAAASAPVNPSTGKKKSISQPTKAELADRQKKFEELLTRKRISGKNLSGVLAISNTLPRKHKNEITASRIANIASSITNPGKKVESYSIKAEKEPLGKFEMEFVVHSSAEMLYEFISTPSGLSEWFCDDLNIRNGIYTFIWDDQLQQARLLKTVELHCVRFQWVEKNDGSYFEFRIQRDELTNDISLIITDFAETVAERESSKLLWHSQVEKLLHVLGSIY
jgi:uncharacterized protein YndB with AHSA1/START domain